MREEYRVKKAADFQRIMGNRRFKNSKAFTVYIDKRTKDHSRYGIAAPKKLGNAVVRNKTKRQIRNMLQDIDMFDTPYDYIVLVRKKYYEQSYDENRKDLENLIKTVKM
ncbi:ribonuclease P protein component [Erysipelothrix tonsillarum]|uniref:ribonuclease P protein component n=1 Tax=Erysipelothrix tonsillarum TaxID=38402 RepID=UPI000360C963|nr:ribonuclease P protein component [Erysipelothrix tonsillarum]